MACDPRGLPTRLSCGKVTSISGIANPWLVPRLNRCQSFRLLLPYDSRVIGNC
jgi:hypothetical protein